MPSALYLTGRARSVFSRDSEEPFASQWGWAISSSFSNRPLLARATAIPADSSIFVVWALKFAETSTKPYSACLSEQKLPWWSGSVGTMMRNSFYRWFALGPPVLAGVCLDLARYCNHRHSASAPFPHEAPCYADSARVMTLHRDSAPSYQRWHHLDPIRQTSLFWHWYADKCPERLLQPHPGLLSGLINQIAYSSHIYSVFSLFLHLSVQRDPVFHQCAWVSLWRIRASRRAGSRAALLYPGMTGISGLKAWGTSGSCSGYPSSKSAYCPNWSSMTDL